MNLKLLLKIKGFIFKKTDENHIEKKKDNASNDKIMYKFPN